MGKGVIISGGPEGQYTASVTFKRDDYTSQVAQLTTRISEVSAQISGLPNGTDRDRLLVQKLGYEKKKSYLIATMPDDETISVWCADLTTNLSGVVGLVEVPGESVLFNIQPGYEGNAVYNTPRDGQLGPTVVQTAAQAYYNIAMLPGWQKWKPTFRYGTITHLYDDICNISLEVAESTQQSLSINQTTTLSNVPIDYMDCDGFAFSEGDDVLIMFENQTWSNPKVIGFKSSPKPCTTKIVLITVDEYCIAWQLGSNDMVDDATDNLGGAVTFPALRSSITTWLATLTGSGTHELPVTSAQVAAASPPHDYDYEDEGTITTSDPYYQHSWGYGGTYELSPAYDVNGVFQSLVATDEFDQYIEEGSPRATVSGGGTQYDPIRVWNKYGTAAEYVTLTFNVLNQGEYRGLYLDKLYEYEFVDGYPTFGIYTDGTITLELKSSFKGLSIDPIIQIVETPATPVDNAIAVNTLRAHAACESFVDADTRHFYVGVAAFRVTGGSAVLNEFQGDLRELAFTSAAYISYVDGAGAEDIKIFNQESDTELSSAVETLIQASIAVNDTFSDPQIAFYDNPE